MTVRLLYAAAALMVLLSAPLHAQVAPKRLSDWLLAEPVAPDAYPLGLSWRVPEEEASQTLLLRDLLRDLSGSDPAVRRLREWVSTLPVTGRVPVAVADARWLQANPLRDPVIQPNHSVIMPSRPRTVTVITGEGERCPVAHVAGREAIAYIEACSPGAARRADWAWIAQPDGRAQRFGVASWNREAQDEPAPGAWIWGPARGSGWPEQVGERLIRFLATQGPADGAAVVAPPSRAFERSRGMGVSASDWGSVGLLQTPSARMAKLGTFSFHFGHTTPYSRGNVFFQPFDWMETGFRYIDISNRLYDPTGQLNTTQSNKDKSIDVKFRVWRESAYMPEIAVGLRDIAGTGLFAGEYLVASKRTGDFDWSLGLGWGNIGARGDFRGFGTRKADIGQGGSFGFGSYFRGPAALFGGVQYQSPWEKLILKAELDGNNYQHEPQGNNQRQSSPFNFGVVYRYAPSVDFTAGLERGNTLMFGITLHTDLQSIGMPKVSDPPRVPVAAARPRQAPAWAVTSTEIERQTGWHVQSIERRRGELRLTLDDAQAGYWRERVDRAAAVLHRDAPAPVDRFVFVYRQGGVDVAEHVVDRGAWVMQNTQFVAPAERYETVVARAPVRLAADRHREEEAGPDPAMVVFEQTRPWFEAGLGFDYQVTLGGPDAFALYQISAMERAKLRLREDTWIDGKLRLGLLNNYDKFKFTAPSNLPRVRTFLREYLTSSRVTIPNLQATHVGKLGENQYYSAYAGYLEEMFAGVGGEWLYRPFASRTAFGVDLNVVRQRDFKQDLSLRDYRTVTGHATWYWDTGWENVQAKISAGRYLAKDVGVTLDLSRVFQNGVRVGAFMTRTNVSAAQFGEGSFDKGIYVSIPFDAMLTRSSGSTANFTWKPLTRDGGAMLARSVTLHNLTTARDERTLWTEPAPRNNENSIPSDRREAWEPAPKAPAPQLRIEKRTAAAAWASDAGQEFRLVQALHRQWFRNIKVTFDESNRLSLTLSNEHLQPVSRAIGYAARTALRFAPLETREIRITFVDGAEPLATYAFVDAVRLERFLDGAIGAKEFADTVALEYHNPGARESDPLALLRELATDEQPRTLGQVLERPRALERVKDDVAAAGKAAAGVDWLGYGLTGAAVVLASVALDKRADRFAANHAQADWSKSAIKAGNAIPWIGLGAAAFAALDGSDQRRSRTGYAAAEAGATAFLAATALKYAVGRPRPDTGIERGAFKPFTTDSRYSAFPSRHTAVAWAVLTPVAQEYDADWLYGVAVLSNLARIGSREHWVSDTVAGSLIGYGVGRVFWESARARKRDGPALLVERSGAKLAWEW